MRYSRFLINNLCKDFTYYIFLLFFIAENIVIGSSESFGRYI